MRPAIYVAAALACAALAPELMRSAVASAASVVLESLPYLVASVVLARLVGPHARGVMAIAGCGCGQGAAARSVPAAVATSLMFGPPIAIARWCAALAVSRLVSRQHDHLHESTLLDEIVALIPSALLCGGIVTVAPLLDLAHCSAFVQALAGAAIGFCGAPCALGGVALAAAVHAQSPIAAGAILSISGIADLGVWRVRRYDKASSDGVAYVAIAIACAVVASQHGASLVHPRMTIPLWVSAVFTCACAMRARGSASAFARAAALGLVAACIFGSPPPPETANEVSVEDAFPGERLDFTGRYIESGGTAHLVRYTITCCRADARPLGVRLRFALPEDRGQWVRARGVLRASENGLVLEAASLSRVPPPADPFVYR